MRAEEYLKEPCTASSLSFRKSLLPMPEGLSVVDGRQSLPHWALELECQKYFKLIHNLKSIPCPALPGFTIKGAERSDLPVMRDIINRSYEDISVDLDYLISLTGLSCYKPDLWLMAYDEKGCPAGCTIAEIGREINEGYIEWLQVLPPFRRKGLGSALVSELLRRMALGGADFCTVSGKASNPSAPEALYRKCGFEGNGLWLVFKKQ